MDEKGLMDVVEMGLQGMNEALHRMRELSVQAASGTLSDLDRKMYSLWWVLKGESEQVGCHIEQSCSAKREYYLYHEQNHGCGLCQGDDDSNKKFNLEQAVIALQVHQLNNSESILSLISWQEL